jgi:hypothetical protein
LPVSRFCFGLDAFSVHGRQRANIADDTSRLDVVVMYGRLIYLLRKHNTTLFFDLAGSQQKQDSRCFTARYNFYHQELFLRRLI